MPGETTGVLRERHEHSLGDVLGGMRVTRHALGGGMDQINVPSDEFGKGRFGTLFRIIAQKLLVGQLVGQRVHL